MPVLPYHTSDPQMGRGVEVLMLPTLDYVDQPIPQLPAEITIDYLRTYPQALPAVREVAKIELLSTAPVDFNGGYLSGSREVAEILGGDSIQKVGKIYTKLVDNGRTTDYIIPMKTKHHHLDLVVNGAWGVMWRLGQKDPLSAKHPSLSVSQVEDTSVIPSGIGVKYGQPRYIDPAVLEAATREQLVDPQVLAERIREIITKLMEKKLTTFDISELSAGRSQLNTFAELCEALTFGEKKMWSYPYFSLFLGSNGVKTVGMGGESGNRNSQVSEELAQEMAEAGEIIKAFYLPYKKEQ